MTILLLFLMAYQVTGEVLHEWIGIAMTILVIVHQILNRRWYKALFKGKYNTYRVVTTVNNTLLLCSFALTAFCGMAMSGYAVPFLYGMTSVSFARRFHLAMSHWSFVLMGLHLGLHVPAMVSKLKLSQKVRNIVSVVFAIAAGYGLFLFLRNNMADYMFFRVPFAFLDYEKSKVLVLLENLLEFLCDHDLCCPVALHDRWDVESAADLVFKPGIRKVNHGFAPSAHVAPKCA